MSVVRDGAATTGRLSRFEHEDWGVTLSARVETFPGGGVQARVGATVQLLNLLQGRGGLVGGGVKVWVGQAAGAWQAAG